MIDDLDWDAGTEARYEQHWNRVLAIGLCEQCGENAALPDDDWCADCLSELTWPLSNRDPGDEHREAA